MDWNKLAQQDFQPLAFDTLEEGSERCRVLKATYSDPSSILQWDLESDNEWSSWLAQGLIPEVDDFEKGLMVILAERRDDESKAHNYRRLTSLPWSQSTFAEIVTRMHINGSVISTINGGDVAMFTRTYITRQTDPISAIVYNCRTANAWPGDMAMSVTYVPATSSTYAIVLGCSKDSIDRISRLLSNAGTSICHPLLLPRLLVELELHRHDNLVKTGLTQVKQFVNDLLKNKTYDWKARGKKEEDMSTSTSVEQWMGICQVQNKLTSWERQLLNMADSMDELSETEFAKIVPRDPVNKDAVFRKTMQEEGAFLRDRIRVIATEYEDKIRDCQMIMESMSMATQMAHTKANMEIALHAKRDGSQMKSIAVLTMLFLPSTFVSTLFAMPFFDWKPDHGRPTASSWLWIYFVVSISLTCVTCGLWYVFVNFWGVKRPRRKPDYGEMSTV